MNRAQLKQMAKDQIKGNVLNLFLISLIVAVISYAASMIPVASLIITPVLSLATIHVYLKLAKGTKPEIGELFGHFDQLLPAIKVYLLNYLYVVLWSLLLIVPGIIKGYAYSQCMYILAENPNIGAREALKKSEQMMNGHKMEYFVLCLSFMGWLILGAFTFGILYVWVLPYMQATMTNFYNSIKPVYASDENTYVDDAYETYDGASYAYGSDAYGKSGE